MATNGNGSSGLSQIPIFKGTMYQFWELKMKTLFKSQELWELVDQGFEDPRPAEPDAQLREKRKKDAKALFLIQQALDDEIFPRIASAITAKEAWDSLKTEYLGDKKVVKVRLQSLRREFETALMGDNESVQVYLSRISNVIQQMKAYGEKITDEHVVGKVLRSLTNKYDHVVAAIEESKDLENYTFDELMGSLQSHEERMNRGTEKKEEKAFQTREENYSDRSNFRGRGRGRGGFRGRGRGRSSGQRENIPSNESQSSRNSIMCYYCSRTGHKEASEAEYIASGLAGRQAMWLRKLLADLGNEQQTATEIWCDNRSAIAMTKNPAYHARTKHIEVQHHYIRKLVSEGKIELKFCGTNEQSADLFTKGLSQAKHQLFMEKIGIRSI